jgi:hypothetical protein
MGSAGALPIRHLCVSRVCVGKVRKAETGLAPFAW